MLCHHFATIILITFSYVSGLTHIGITVMFVMDNGDFFVGLVRAIMDIAPSYLTFLAYLALMTSWIYF